MYLVKKFFIYRYINLRTYIGKDTIYITLCKTGMFVLHKLVKEYKIKVILSKLFTFN